MGRLVRRLDARGPQRRAVADRAPHKFTESGPNSVDKFVRDELAAMFFARLTTFERTANPMQMWGGLSLSSTAGTEHR